MNLETYNIIKEKYGNISSWAIWEIYKDNRNKNKMDNIDFLINPTPSFLNILNPNIVLVGLNISEKIERTFGNFHPIKTSAQDYKTRFALHDTMFWGAYMTDIIKSYEEKISGNLIINKLFEQENIRLFEQELLDIGSKNPIIIAFGNDSYKILKRNLKDKYKIYKVPHYSSYIKLDNLRISFNEIETLNKKII